MVINISPGKIINQIINPFGIKIKRIKEQKKITFPVEASERDIEIMKAILRLDDPKNALSMVSMERLWAVIQATKYIIKNNIEGDLVECGVWRGGCSLAMAMTLSDFKSNKKVHLFDTFAGMTKPTNFDVTRYGKYAFDKFNLMQKENHNEWCYASIEDVYAQFKKHSLEDYAFFIKGDVLQTLQQKDNLPNQISLLRLDTDWYESTKIEMETLFPKLQENGILLIDDYGDWEGSRKAVDDYLRQNKHNSLLFMTDKSGRALIKQQN